MRKLPLRFYKSDKKYIFSQEQPVFVRKHCLSILMKRSITGDAVLLDI
jgi:hypothetical protein